MSTVTPISKSASSRHKQPQKGRTTEDMSCSSHDDSTTTFEVNKQCLQLIPWPKSFYTIGDHIEAPLDYVCSTERSMIDMRLAWLPSVASSRRPHVMHYDYPGDGNKRNVKVLDPRSQLQ